MNNQRLRISDIGYDLWNAQVVDNGKCTFLRTYPDITVNYPGLACSPWHDVADKVVKCCLRCHAGSRITEQPIPKLCCISHFTKSCVFCNSRIFLFIPFGIKTVFVDISDVNAVEAAINENTRVIFADGW